MTAVDLLVFGPHPDDIEIGLAGTVALHVSQGYRVGLCDLTRGELGSNGTPDERAAEAEAARAVLGADWRVNLRWPDGGITGTDGQIADVVHLVRRCRPRAIAVPYWDDRHPDHRAASEVLTRAVFKAALSRFTPVPPEGETASPAWRPEWLCYYFINDSAPPSFAIDVSAHYDTKRRALACHRSQFAPPAAESVATRLTSPLFQQLIESRDAQLGALTGVAFAEGVIVREPLLRPHIFKDSGGGGSRGAEPRHASERERASHASRLRARYGGQGAAGIGGAPASERAGGIRGAKRRRASERERAGHASGAGIGGAPASERAGGIRGAKPPGQL